MAWSEATKTSVVAAIEQSLRTCSMRAIRSCCPHLLDHEIVNQLYIALADESKVSGWILEVASQVQNREKEADKQRKNDRLKKIVYHGCRFALLNLVRQEQQYFKLLNLVRQEQRCPKRHVNGESSDETESPKEVEEIQIAHYLPCLPNQLQTVLGLYLRGKSNAEIAEELSVSTRTIRRYLEQIVKLLRLKLV